MKENIIFFVCHKERVRNVSATDLCKPGSEPEAPHTMSVRHASFSVCEVLASLWLCGRSESSTQVSDVKVNDDTENNEWMVNSPIELCVSTFFKGRHNGFNSFWDSTPRRTVCGCGGLCLCRHHELYLFTKLRKLFFLFLTLWKGNSGNVSLEVTGSQLVVSPSVAGPCYGALHLNFTSALCLMNPCFALALWLEKIAVRDAARKKTHAIKYTSYNHM